MDLKLKENIPYIEYRKKPVFPRTKFPKDLIRTFMRGTVGRKKS